MYWKQDLWIFIIYLLLPLFLRPNNSKIKFIMPTAWNCWTSSLYYGILEQIQTVNELYYYTHKTNGISLHFVWRLCTKMWAFLLLSAFHILCHCLFSPSLCLFLNLYSLILIRFFFVLFFVQNIPLHCNAVTFWHFNSWIIYKYKFFVYFFFHFNLERNHVCQRWPVEKHTPKRSYKMPLKRFSVENWAHGELLYFMVYRDRLYETKSINWLWSKNGKQIC